jgi:hypothetical protein
MDAQWMALLVGVTLVAGFSILLVRLLTHRTAVAATPEFLLSEEDYAFLAAQPGYKPAIARELRRRRRAAFRSYLRVMSRDFDRLYGAAKQIALFSERDRQDLIVLLVRQKIAFECGLALAHVRLGLHALGLPPADVRGLIDALDQMSQQARSFVPIGVSPAA